MKYLFLATSSFLAIVAQMIAGRNFFLFNFLDFSLLLIAYWALYRNRNQALFVGSLTGILLDATLGWPLGYNGFGRTLAAFVICAAARRINIDGGGVRFVLLGVASLLSSASIFVLFALLQRSSNVLFLEASFMQAIVTAAVGTVAMSMLDSYQRTHTNKLS